MPFLQARCVTYLYKSSSCGSSSTGLISVAAVAVLSGEASEVVDEARTHSTFRLQTG